MLAVLFVVLVVVVVAAAVDDNEGMNTDQIVLAVYGSHEEDYWSVLVLGLLHTRLHSMVDTHWADNSVSVGNLLVDLVDSNAGVGIRFDLVVDIAVDDVEDEVDLGVVFVVVAAADSHSLDCNESLLLPDMRDIDCNAWRNRFDLLLDAMEAQSRLYNFPFLVAPADAPADAAAADNEEDFRWKMDNV